MTERKFPSNFNPATSNPDEGSLTVSEIVALAWDDETSFDDIKVQSGLAEKDVIAIMRAHMKPSSFKMWRKRVSGRASKHRVKL